MRRSIAATALFLALAVPGAWAQHENATERAEKAAEAKTEGEGGMEVWAWLNFAVLAAGLGWLYRKNGVPYFVSRATGIRRGMLEADDARLEAERRISAVEARFGHLQSDIQALKETALVEQKAELERMRKETVAELAKIQAHAEQEIVSAGKAARGELKRYSAHLALSLAEQKLRARVDAATQDALFRGFVKELGAVSSPQGN